jgi:uncharacterized protein (TIGR03089 family)
MYDGEMRVELSGATTANWVAKSANLLVDGLGGPDPVGLLLPLHWQAVALLLAGVATGARVVIAEHPGDLAACAAAFVLADDAEAALRAGVDDVLALSGHPLGAPAGGLPALVTDYAREVPSYGDHYGGPRPDEVVVELRGAAVSPLTGLSPGDRLVTTLALSEPGGAAAALAALHVGAALVLLRTGDPTAVAAAERATHSAGTDVPGLTRVA